MQVRLAVHDHLRPFRVTGPGQSCLPGLIKPQRAPRLLSHRLPCVHWHSASSGKAPGSLPSAPGWITQGLLSLRAACWSLRRGPRTSPPLVLLGFGSSESPEGRSRAVMRLLGICHRDEHTQGQCLMDVYWTRLSLAGKGGINVRMTYGGPGLTWLVHSCLQQLPMEGQEGHVSGGHRVPVLKDLVLS